MLSEGRIRIATWSTAARSRYIYSMFPVSAIFPCPNWLGWEGVNTERTQELQLTACLLVTQLDLMGFIRLPSQKEAKKYKPYEEQHRTVHIGWEHTHLLGILGRPSFTAAQD